MDTATENNGYTWKYEIDLGDAVSATVCFNNGNGSWDSNNGSNYIVKVGDYGIKNRIVKKLSQDGSNKLTVYYKNNSWSSAYIHYKTDNGLWTVAPGVKMSISDNSDYTWMYVIDLGDSLGATVCFNNGSGSWDSRNGSNYYLIGNQVGVTNGSVYLIQ